MRKTFRFLAFAAAAAATLVSCNKEIETLEVQGPLKLVIRANAPTTKTAITDNGDGSYTPSWVGTTDKIGVFFTSVTGTPISFTNTETGSAAWFEPDEELSGISGNQTLYSFYPFAAFNEVTSGTSVRMNVKTDQVPTAVGTFDPAADILVAEPYAGNMTTINTDGAIVDMAFARILSVVKIIPTDATSDDVLDGEYIKSVKIAYNGSGEDEPLTGRVVLDLNSGELGSWSIKTYSANVAYDDDAFALNGTNAAYIIVNPATIASGKTVTFTVKTNKHDVTKEITLTKALAFPAGNIAKINLSLDDDCTIEDNTVDPNVIFSTPFYANISSNTTYDSATHGNLGVVGSSKSTITYTFDGTSQLRNNSNKISDDDASFYWCTSSTGLAIGGINVGTNRYFNLTFDGKLTSTGSTTLAFSLSNDGTHFFPITPDATHTMTGTSVVHPSFNFSIPEGEYTNLSFKIENKGSNGAVIDNVTLTKLTEAGESNTAVSFTVVAVDPTLEVTPSPVNLLEGSTQQLTVTGTDGAISYESNDTDVATVSSTGLITAVAEGTTTIAITSAATEDYNAGATSVTVNVSASLSFETVVITESWSADLKNTTGNNAKFVDDGQSIWTVSGTYGRVAANNANAASFYSPKFDMTDVEAGTITFSHTGNVTGTDYQSLGKVYYTLDDGTNWTQITLTNPSSNWSWQTATISSEVFAGETIQFRWDFQGNSSKTWEVKDFVITVPEHSITVNGEASPLTVELNGDATKSTTLTIASGYAWSVKSTTGQPANYTYTKDSDTQITVTPAADNTSGSTNTGIGTMVLTDGTVDFTITFDQANKGALALVEKELKATYSSHDGWTVTGTGGTSYWVMKEGASIVSPSFSFNSIKSVVIKTRTYGGATYKTTDVYYGETKLGSVNASGTTLANQTLTVATSPAAGTGSLTFSSSTTSSSNGPGISEITITYDVYE